MRGPCLVAGEDVSGLVAEDTCQCSLRLRGGPALLNRRCTQEEVAMGHAICHTMAQLLILSTGGAHKHCQGTLRWGHTMA